MACTKPLDAWRPVKNGPLLFHPPTKKNGRAYTKIELPCGYCITCQEEKARQWAVRIHHEAQMHESNSFVTLSYDDEHLPPNNSLRFDDLYGFWKRLRTHLKRKHEAKLKFFAAGEYGDLTQRPHYHACIFGQDFTEGATRVRGGDQPLWTCAWLANLWGHGFVAVGQLTFETARYTASYVVKKLVQKQRYCYVDETTGELIALEQPRASMSKNIARSWWNIHRHHVSAHDVVVINGKKQKPPKAYDRWLGEENEIPLQMIKEERVKHAVKLSKDEKHARAENARARIKSKSKKL